MAQPRAVGDREAELVVAERVFGGVVALGVAVSGSGAADVTHGTRTGVGGDGEILLFSFLIIFFFFISYKKT